MRQNSRTCTTSDTNHRCFHCTHMPCKNTFCCLTRPQLVKEVKEETRDLLADIMMKLKLTWEPSQGCHEEMITLYQSKRKELEVSCVLQRMVSMIFTVCYVLYCIIIRLMCFLGKDDEE